MKIQSVGIMMNYIPRHKNGTLADAIFLFFNLLGNCFVYFIEVLLFVCAEDDDFFVNCQYYTRLIACIRVPRVSAELVIFEVSE